MATALSSPGVSEKNEWSTSDRYLPFMTTRLPSIVRARARVDSEKVTCLCMVVSLPREFPEGDTSCCSRPYGAVRRAVLVESSIVELLLYVSILEYSHVDDVGEESLAPQVTMTRAFIVMNQTVQLTSGRSAENRVRLVPSAAYITFSNLNNYAVVEAADCQ